MEGMSKSVLLLEGVAGVVPEGEDSEVDREVDPVEVLEVVDTMTEVMDKADMVEEVVVAMGVTDKDIEMMGHMVALTDMAGEDIVTDIKHLKKEGNFIILI